MLSNQERKLQEMNLSLQQSNIVSYKFGCVDFKTIRPNDPKINIVKKRPVKWYEITEYEDGCKEKVISYQNNHSVDLKLYRPDGKISVSHVSGRFSFYEYLQDGRLLSWKRSDGSFKINEYSEDGELIKTKCHIKKYDWSKQIVTSEYEYES